MEVIHSVPDASSFTPLSEHQSRTPESFYSGPAVLYHHSPDARLLLRVSSIRASPAISKLVEDEIGTAESIGDTSEGLVNGNGEETGEDKEMTIGGVDIWVTSEHFLLFRPSVSIGLSIPYPTISLHAISSEGLYLQLATTSTPFDDHDPASSAELTLVPAPSSTPVTELGSAAGAPDANPEAQRNEPASSPIAALFAALSACANLHPDPAEDDETAMDGVLDDESRAPYAMVGGGAPGLPPPMPGSGGWITADNMEEFFDSDGNWRNNNNAAEETAHGGLGSGAGAVRGRDEDRDGDRGRSMIDDEAASEETKWRRTE